MHTKCYKTHTLPAEMYPIFIYVQSNEKQVSLCPLSTNLITEEVPLASVLANTATSPKLRAWYGIGFTSLRVT